MTKEISKPKTERAIQGEIVRKLRKMGWKVRICTIKGLPVVRGMKILKYRKNPMKGHPDLIISNKEAKKFAYIETKTVKGRLSPEQVEFRDDIQAGGGIWFLIRSLKDLVQEYFNLKVKK